MFVCPFAVTPNYVYYCSKECALYDAEYERCTFLSIAKTLESITDPNNLTTLKVKEA